MQIGRDALDPYIIHLLYGEYLPVEKVGFVLIWNLEWAITRWETEADLIFFRSPRFQPPETIANRMFRIPYYVQQVVKLPPANSNLLSHFHNRATKLYFNRIRKAKFEYEISHDHEMLGYFYNHLYVPFIEERHGESAEVVSWPTFLARYGSMELLIVRRNGQIVAGIVNNHIDSCYWLHVLAALPNDISLLRMEVISALYWFSFVEAHRRGCHTVDLGAVRPFLNNGLLIYKRKWSSLTVPSIYKTELGLWSLACGRRPSLYRALEGNPFICQRNGNLIGLIFLGDNTPLNDEEMARHLKQYLLSGEFLSFQIVLLTKALAAKRQSIEMVVRRFPQSIRILDLSNGYPCELPGLLSASEVVEKMA